MSPYTTYLPLLKFKLLTNKIINIKMTKLTEWIILAGLAFSLWITLLVDFFPIRISYEAKEVLWPVSMEISRETMQFVSTFDEGVFAIGTQQE